MANMCRSRTGDWSVVIGRGLALALGLLYIFVYIFSFSSLVRVVANLRRCLHYHIIVAYHRNYVFRLVRTQWT